MDQKLDWEKFNAVKAADDLALLQIVGIGLTALTVPSMRESMTQLLVNRVEARWFS